MIPRKDAVCISECRTAGNIERVKRYWRLVGHPNASCLKYCWMPRTYRYVSISLVPQNLLTAISGVKQQRSSPHIRGIFFIYKVGKEAPGPVWCIVEDSRDPWRPISHKRSRTQGERRFRLTECTGHSPSSSIIIDRVLQSSFITRAYTASFR